MVSAGYELFIGTRWQTSFARGVMSNQFERAPAAWKFPSAIDQVALIPGDGQTASRLPIMLAMKHPDCDSGEQGTVAGCGSL